MDNFHNRTQKCYIISWIYRQDDHLNDKNRRWKWIKDNLQIFFDLKPEQIEYTENEVPVRIFPDQENVNDFLIANEDDDNNCYHNNNNKNDDDKFIYALKNEFFFEFVTNVNIEIEQTSFDDDDDDDYDDDGGGGGGGGEEGEDLNDGEHHYFDDDYDLLENSSDIEEYQEYQELNEEEQEYEIKMQQQPQQQQMETEEQKWRQEEEQKVADKQEQEQDLQQQQQQDLQHDMDFQHEQYQYLQMEMEEENSYQISDRNIISLLTPATPEEQPIIKKRKKSQDISHTYISSSSSTSMDVIEIDHTPQQSNTASIPATDFNSLEELTICKICHLLLRPDKEEDHLKISHPNRNSYKQKDIERLELTKQKSPEILLNVNKSREENIIEFGGCRRYLNGFSFTEIMEADISGNLTDSDLENILNSGGAVFTTAEIKEELKRIEKEEERKNKRTKA